MALNQAILTQIRSSSMIKTPFTKTRNMSFIPSPQMEININNNNYSPIFVMSPFNSVQFARTIDEASSFSPSIQQSNNHNNITQLPPLSPMYQLSISVSPPHIDIKPLLALSTMQNSLYERRMKAKLEQEKQEKEQMQ